MMTLSEVAKALDGVLTGADVRFGGVSTDTRSITAGELFVALRGDRFDGHGFLDAAKAGGAVAAIVDRRHPGTGPLPAVVVEDSKAALGALARHWRSRFTPVLIGIAGSNGKTTTKEMLAAILRRHAGDAHVLATRGNLNNEIGMPLTLLKLRAAHRFCAIELGMNHKGEIAVLAEVARPTIAVVTNAQREHLEFMHSVEEVAEENADLYRALPADGVAVINCDDDRAGVFRKAARPRRTVEFGLNAAASVTGGYALRPVSSDIRVRTPSGETTATLAIPGVHNVRNALAASACAHAAGVPVAAIGAGLTAFRPYTGRLQVKRTPAGTTVLDDSYNANPDSVRAAIDVLAAVQGPTLLVLGDMGEVGEQGPRFHAEVGAYARERGVGGLYAMGELARYAADAFGPNARHFESHEALAVAAQKAADAGATLLVKGSRFMRMERVVAELTGQQLGSH
jgi:UDP-N-acetylmuramoyl-tripeptide--D-alanyl-D-alanine ligase